MERYIHDDLIEEIRSKVDLVEVASEYLPLKRTGQNYKALCPFHKEKTPSFVVNPAKGIFHCFGCGIGGNLFSFIMKMERVTFPEAIRILARRCGVKVPSFGGKVDGEKESLYKVNETARDFFKEQLLSLEGRAALRYLMDRGLKKEIIDSFGLGYASGGWGRLRDFLLSKGFDLHEIERSGLIILKGEREGRERRDYYDRFRQRITFPILDIRGRVVGFGARRLGEGEPKYINSPETPVYNKGSLLYGMNMARATIQEHEEAIIVEGYMDVILAHQHGFTNVVGSCGTALTPSQARLLKAYTKNVVILYDPDPSGAKATLRGVETILEEGLGVKVALLPRGYDPADLLVKKGKEAFRESILRAKDFFDYRLEIATEGVDLSSIDGKRRVIEALIPTITRTSNPIQRHTYIKRVAESLRIDERIIGEEVKAALKGKAPVVDIKEYLGAKKRGVVECERALIGLILRNNTILKEIGEEVFGEELADPVNNRIVSVMKDLFQKEGRIDTSRLLDLLGEDEKGVVSSLIIEEQLDEGRVALARAYLKRIKEYRINRRIEDLKTRIDHLKEEDLKEALLRYQDLVKEVKVLREG